MDICIILQNQGKGNKENHKILYIYIYVISKERKKHSKEEIKEN